MYDVGLSALVLKICSDYSQSLGLNFPPNIQQEINAIAQWVDTHTVKDISFTQDGNVVTVTATTQNNSSQSWVFTLPDISVDKLYTMIKGSGGVNVDYSEDRNSLVVSLDKSQEFQSVKVQSAPIENDDVVRKLELDKKLTKPANPTAESAVTMLANGTVGTKPLSEIGGGGKLYIHNMYFYSSQSDGFKITVYNSDITNFTPETFFADSKNSGLYCSGIVLKEGKAYPISEILINSALKRVIYIKSDGSQTFINIDPTILEGPDKVYEV